MSGTLSLTMALRNGVVPPALQHNYALNIYVTILMNMRIQINCTSCFTLTGEFSLFNSNVHEMTRGSVANIIILPQWKNNYIGWQALSDRHYRFS